MSLSPRTSEAIKPASLLCFIWRLYNRQMPSKRNLTGLLSFPHAGHWCTAITLRLFSCRQQHAVTYLHLNVISLITSLPFFSLNWLTDVSVHGCQQLCSFKIYDPEPQQTQSWKHVYPCNILWLFSRSWVWFEGWNVGCVLCVSRISSYYAVSCPIKTKDSEHRKKLYNGIKSLGQPLCKRLEGLADV